MTDAVIDFAERLNLNFIAKFFKKLQSRIIARRLMIQTRNELQSLGSRELADMGITRCDIPRISKEVYEKHIEVNENIKGWV